MEYAGGIAAGVVSSVSIAPIMMILDTAIIRSQFQGSTLGQAIKGTVKDIASRRVPWNPSLNIMCAAYGATFVTANSVRVLCKQTNTNPVIPMAIATWGVKSVAMALKDRAYAMLLNPAAATKAMFPTSSLLLFGARDAFTISAAFTCKEQVRDYMVNVLKMDTIMSEGVSTFGVIMAAQFISTPFHIVALDQYVRPEASLASRLQLIKSQFLTITAGRMIRIVPALGLGTYINDFIREEIEERVEDRFVAGLPQPAMTSQINGGSQLVRTDSMNTIVTSAKTPVAAAVLAHQQKQKQQGGEPPVPPKAVRIQRRNTIRG